MSKVHTVKLGEVTEIARGSSPRPIRDQAYFDGGTIPWVKIADATASTKYIYKTKQYVNDYGASFSRKLPPGSLIVAASGTLGFAIFLGVEGCVHDGWLYFKHIDESRLDKDYLYFVLNGLTASFNAMSYGAAIQNINTKILREIEVKLPELEAQRKIAATVSAYDDLIETNKRRIALLEKMAEELYREWFVRMRFPGHQNTKFAKGVPERWTIRPIGELCSTVTDGSHFSPPFVEGGKSMASVKDMHTHGFDLTSVKTISDADFETLKKGDCQPLTNDVLIAKDGSYLKHVFVWGEDYEIVILSSIAILRPNLKEIKPHFFAQVLRQPSTKSMMSGYVSGSALPRIILKDFKKMKLLIPTSDLMDSYEESAETIFRQIGGLLNINENLTRTRDLLLPRLISGKLSVEGLDIQFPPSMQQEAAKPKPAHA